jgi:hypothetical protein
MLETTNRKRRRLAAWIAAGGCGLWLLAQAVPADAQASRTRPGGGSSSSSASSGGGGSSSSSGGGSSASPSGGSSSPSAPVRVGRTRPRGSSSGSPTVVEGRRPGRPGGGHFPGHGHFHGWYGYPYYWSWWLGWNWWYPSWGYPYPYYPPYGGGVYPHGGEALGALDTDVWPARTQIWIDGRYVGFVDQFDGFPRYLWLEKGTYDVVFYLEGYRTLARQYTVYPGLVIDVEDRLEPGESIHPTDLAPAATPRRDARERAESEREAAAAEPEWRRRVEADREAAREREEIGAPEVEAGAWLVLGVTPADAAVYLDGEFVGTGGEVSRRGTGLRVEPGEHELSVVRPGYEPEVVEFEVDAGGEVTIEVDLDAVS